MPKSARSPLASPASLALFEQDLVPASADWPALKAALLAVEGLTEAHVDMQGIIHVVLDGEAVRARLDYRVFVAVEPEAEEAGLRAVGDRSGNGQPDFDVIYLNGDVQTLYLFSPLPFRSCTVGSDGVEVALMPSSASGFSAPADHFLRQQIRRCATPPYALRACGSRTVLTLFRICWRRKDVV